MYQFANQDSHSPFDASPRAVPYENLDASPTSTSSFRNMAGDYPFPPHYSQPSDMTGRRHQYRHSLAVPVMHPHGHGRVQRQTTNRGRTPARTPQNPPTGQRSTSSNAAEQTYGHGTARFLQDPDPWAPRTFDIQSSLSPINQDPYNFSTYRESNQIDSFSEAGYHVPADSAYVSQATASIYSAPVEPSAELHTDDIDPQLDDRLRIDDSSSIRSTNTRSDRRRGSQRRTSSSKRYTPVKCRHCNDVPKCESDYKKHMLKHEKNFLCDFSGCKRSHEGFGTINDLNRHKKSVHRLSSHSSRSFRCQARTCEHNDKMWPRYDNFKQHVIRVHKDEHGGDEQKINNMIEKSEIRPGQQQRGHQQLPSQMPHSELLAGIGGTSIGNASIPTIGVSNGELVSPESLNLIGWPTDLEQVRAMEEQGILPTQLSTAPSRQKKLSKSGQTLQQQKQQQQQQQQVAPPSATKDGMDGIHHHHHNNNNNHRTEQLATRSSDQRLSALAEVAVASVSPEVRITEPSAPNPPLKRRKLSDVSEPSHTATARRASQQSHTTHLGDRIGANLPQQEKRELLEALALVANPERIVELLKRDQKPVPPEAERASRRRSNTTLSSSHIDGGIPCTYCEKMLPRNCDMKKHMKRHTRPYGCTFPQCHKLFGSKNDWKRHENSQHFHQEMWRCQEACDPSIGGGAPDGRCGRIFWFAKTFSRHLKTERHAAASGLSREQRYARIQECRIGRSGHTRYWCGFCKEIIPVNGQLGQAAWDQRFTHIDERHYKNGQLIDEWLCIVTRVTKGEEHEGVLKHGTASSGPDQAEMMEDCNLPDLSSDDEDPMMSGGPPILDSEPGSPLQEAVDPVLVAQAPIISQKVQRSDDRNEPALYCCQCGYGPFGSGSLYGGCVGDNCTHNFCTNCYSKAGLPPPRLT